MVGPTAQLVALACRFNARARCISADPFFPGNSTCQFCEFVHFVRRKSWFRKNEWNVVAHSPDEWLAAEAQPSRRAVLTRRETNDRTLSDRMSAGFVGGGGDWKLHVIEAGRANSWTPGWRVGDRNSPDRRIWRVAYALSAENIAFTAPEMESLESLRTQLQHSLSAMLSFCDANKIQGFPSFFQTGMQCLDSNEPLSLVYHKDLAPPGVLSLRAQQLLACCNAAWVFGGMGSWNDLMFKGEEQERYERISQRLFATMNDAICAATNSGA